MFTPRIRKIIKSILPKPVLVLLNRKPFIFLRPESIISVITFLFKRYPTVSFFQKLSIIKRLYFISCAVECAHIQHEIISFIKAILSIPEHMKGCVVEAGSFKGGSTAKFSIAAKIVDRALVVFDSFEGIPEHDELPDKTLTGDSVSFAKGSYCGTLEEVKANVSRYGQIEVCKFVKGWFDNTLPEFSDPVVAIYLDVDLASSTRTCLKYLYPLLVEGGVLYSQDGHLRQIVDVFNDNKFWEREVGFRKPAIKNLGKERLIKIVKPIE